MWNSVQYMSVDLVKFRGFLSVLPRQKPSPHFFPRQLGDLLRIPRLIQKWAEEATSGYIMIGKVDELYPAPDAGLT